MPNPGTPARRAKNATNLTKTPTSRKGRSARRDLSQQQEDVEDVDATPKIPQTWSARAIPQQKETADADTTPRPPSAFGDAPVLSHKTASTSRDSSTRGFSPAKMAALKSMKGGHEYTLINVANVEDQEDHALRSVCGFLSQLDDVAEGAGLLPLSAQTTVRADHRMRRELKLPHYFDNTPARQDLGGWPTVEEVVNLCDKSVEYDEEQENEAAWNCAVHWPVASLALRLSAFTKELELKNMYVIP